MKARFHSILQYTRITKSKIKDTLTHISQFSTLASVTIQLKKMPVSFDKKPLNISTAQKSITDIILHCTTSDAIDSAFDYIINDVESFLDYIVKNGRKHGIQYVLNKLSEAELFCEEQIAGYDFNRILKFRAFLKIKMTDGKTDKYPTRQMLFSLLENDDITLITEAMGIRKELWQEILLLIRKTTISTKTSFEQLSPLESVAEIPAPLLVQLLHIFWESDYIESRADFEKFEKHNITLLGYNKRKYDKAKSEYRSRKRDRMKALRELIDHLTQKLNPPKKVTDN